MIVVMNKNHTNEDLNKVVNYIESKNLKANISKNNHDCVIGILGDKVEANLEEIKSFSNVSEVLNVKEPFKKSNRLFHSEDTVVNINGNKIGGNNLGIIAGPCAVESEEQIVEIAKKVKLSGANFLRGGAFKPRTSPYSFQGLEEEGIKLLLKAKEITGLPIVAEITSISNLALYKDVDIIQVGTRNMFNYEMLKALGKTDKIILLKRGMCATVEEWLNAAEYIMKYGNNNVILCERGIRSFDSETRNVLDIQAIPVIKKYTDLKIIVDPSHASGKRYMIKSMSLASIVAGCDGLLIESSINPDNTICDSKQTVDINTVKDIIDDIKILKSIKLK